MSDPENFLTRWSRRKQQASEDTAADVQAAPETTSGPPAESRETESFDPASLPPVESLGPGSDIRAFLQKNVPADLTRAALRRAWSADPAIRDFVGLSENSWDFNAPETIPGFGPLEMNDDVRRMLAEICGEKAAAPAHTPAAPAPEDADPVAGPDENSAARLTQPSENDALGSNMASGDPTQDGAWASGAAEQQESIATQRDDPTELTERPASHKHDRGQERPHGRALPR